MSRKSQSMYGISRIDDEKYHTHAWRVSLKRRGTALVKNFPDLKHGGKGKALREAKRHRDQLLRKHPPLTRLEHACILRRHNRTGISGVCRFASRYRLKSGKVRYIWYWDAIWPTQMGEHRSVRFSINRFGEKGAFERALAARQRGLKQLKGVFWRCQVAQASKERQ